jgi:hypothetical protein
VLVCEKIDSQPLASFLFWCRARQAVCEGIREPANERACEKQQALAYFTTPHYGLSIADSLITFIEEWVEKIPLGKLHFS